MEEADIELQNDVNFVNGYNHAAREDKAQDDLYNLGYKYFEDGVPIHSIPEIYANNDYFIRGYSEALRLSLINEKTSSKRR